MLPVISSDRPALGPTILLLEGNADRAVFLGEILSGIDGATVLRAGRRPEEARAALAAGGFDAVVLDLDALHRLELLDAVRRRAPDATVVALVGPFEDPELGREALERGADDVLENTATLAPALRRSLLQATLRRAESERLARRVQDLELFTRTAAHDLQGPLRAMNLVVEMLLEGDDGRLRRDQVECLLALRSQVHKLDALTDGLLELGTLGRDGLRLRPVPVDDVVTEVVELLGPSRGAQVRFGPMPTVLADRSLLVSLLYNLADNGLQFVRGRTPEVRICATRDEGMVRVEVSDVGVGIPEHQWERVFLPFVRGAVAADTPGRGLGLTLCRRIVDLHGGAIWIEGSGEQGTTMAFTLPAG